MMRSRFENARFLLLGAGISAALFGGQVLAQPVGLQPRFQRRCTNIVLVSDDPRLPADVVLGYLQRRADVQNSNLRLIRDERAADAVIELHQADDHTSRLVVSNRLNGEIGSLNSDWVLYPGMIAMDAVQLLNRACPGSVVSPIAATTPGTTCSKPPDELRNVSNIAVCSQTSWMPQRYLSQVLESRAEVKRLHIAIQPNCGSGDATLVLTHNLDVTVEWYWKLRASDGRPITAGRVIAFNKQEAASKIAAALGSQIAAAQGEVAPIPDSSGDARKPDSPHVARALLLPNDFSVFDTRTLLYTDGERALARGVDGRILFDIRREQVLDARLYADWRREYQLSDPAEVIIPSAMKIVAALELHPVDDHLMSISKTCRIEDALWASTVPRPLDSLSGVQSNVCPALMASTMAFLAAESVGYFSVGTLLAQIPTRSEILELVWEQDGRVKTISLQVPLHESKRLLNALRPVAQDSSESACDIAPELNPRL